MVNLKFQIDKEEDIKIWLHFLNNKEKRTSYGHDRLSGLPKEFLDSVLDKPEDKQRKVILSYIEKYYAPKYIDKFKSESYNKIKDNLDAIISALEMLHNRKLPVKNIIVKYETFNCCPYIWQGKESDTFGLFFARYVLDRGSEVAVFCHEVMHLFFHFYFFDYCLSKGLTRNQAMDLKEAVTVLLNLDPTLSKLLGTGITDYGHKGHKLLRQTITDIYNSQEEKDFQKLLDVAIENMKKQNI
ncbi:MAG TPA: hypothetical protein P5530_03300 [Candidatus Diapherotrites archaeon]|jgi:hypothetical protein|nr:hypothetical protein [Candidatus Diapherotrites archaeon]